MTSPILHRKEYTEGKTRCVLKVEGGLHMIHGNGAPYFTVTAELYENGRWAGGGCQHDLILQHFPDLADLVALHLSNIDGQPMHAEANGFYKLAGAFPDAFGERYHAGNSKRNFLDGYRLPTGDECLQDFADHCRISLAEAATIRDQVQAVAMASRHSRNAVAKAELAKIIETMRPRWKAEAEACIAKHGLTVFGDAWQPDLAKTA